MVARPDPQQAAEQHDNPTPAVAPLHPPLVVLAGPTASGKSHLALRLAERTSAEIVSCDSVSVYRGMEIGTAKPSREDRALVPHHCLDLVDPDQPFSAGDWARHAREAIHGTTARGRLPIIVGGTGLYLRALLDGLFPAPLVEPALRDRLRTLAGRRGPAHLHRLLTRLDPHAAGTIHRNDTPKLLRALALRLTARQPLATQWQQGGRDALAGFRVLRLTLEPPRRELHHRINQRATQMFSRGLVDETERLLELFGRDRPAQDLPRALLSLGYAQALAVLQGTLTREQAVAEAQAGHRQYSKRQGTWFRKEALLHPETHTIPHFGDDPAALSSALALLEHHLTPS